MDLGRCGGPEQRSLGMPREMPAAHPSHQALSRIPALWENLEATPKAHRENRARSSPGGAGGRALKVFLPLRV